MITKIDVVIPSYNFSEDLINRIRKIKTPKEIEIKYFIIIDNPVLKIPNIYRGKLPYNYCIYF